MESGDGSEQMQALISLCDGEEDYFEGFFDIQNSSEDAAIKLVREVGKYDLKRKIRSAQVRVDGITHRFDRSELEEAEESQVVACRTCQMPDLIKPSHEGSPRCQSGSIASGGKNAHCTCDVCF
jgi:hypothetical protein